MSVRSMNQRFENLRTWADKSPRHSVERPTSSVKHLIAQYDKMSASNQPTTPMMKQKNQAKKPPAVSSTTATSTKTTTTTFISKIPPPKSRERHLAINTARKIKANATHQPNSHDSRNQQGNCDSSSSRISAIQTNHLNSSTPASVRMRSPGTSYAAFVARIGNSQSRLLDFEKDERWLTQLRNAKRRVEALKIKNQINLVKEVQKIPRKRRTLSDSSSVSTASTAST